MGSSLKRRWAFWTAGIARPVRAIIVAVLLLILPTIGIIRDVVLQPEDRNWGLLKYMPKIGWYWYAIVILVGLLILLEETSFRAHRSGLRAQRIKHIERFANYRERYPTQPPLVIIQGTPDPPNLVSSAQKRRVYRDSSGVVFERDAGDEADSDVWAVTADFNNAILEKRKPGEMRDISARINFNPFQGNQYVTLDRAAWLRERSGKVVFGVNDTRELVVATLEQERMYGVKQLPAAEDSKVTTRVELANAPYDVHVRLNSELEKKVIKRVHYVLEFAPESETGIRLTLGYRWKADRLGEFNETAYDLFEKAIALAQAKLGGDSVDMEAEKTIEAQFHEWEDQVAEFLIKRWDDAHKQRFLPDPPKPKPDAPAWTRRLWTSPEPPELHSKILAKTKILTEFQGELMREPLKELAMGR